MLRKIFKGASVFMLLIGASAAVYAAGKNAISKPPRVEMIPITDNIIRVTNYSVYPDVEYVSRAVVLEPKKDLNITKTDTKEHLTFTTMAGLTATLDKTTGKVIISDGTGRKVTDDGFRKIGNNGRQRLSITTEGGGSFYGAGERGYSFNLAGDTLVMYNKQNYGYTGDDTRIKQMNITMPMFISSDGYAILFDDFGSGEMIMTNPIEYITVSRHPVSYYYIGGGTMEKVMENLTALVGRQKLPPLWSLGYITSKYGYRTQDEAIGVIDTLKREGYPVDGIVLDLYWYGKEQDMGRLAWDPVQWPDYKGMLSQLQDSGVNMIIISQPYILRNGRGIENFNTLDSEGMLVQNKDGGTQEVKIWVGEGGMFDMSNPQTRQWLANRYKQLTDEGVAGWWGDLGEPEVHPDTGIHANGLTTAEYHNQYGNDWSSIISDMWSKEYPDRRLMTMMRGGTIGLQRYNVFPWSTDVSRTWGGLSPQITIMLNSGLSGLGYMSHDVGGFAITDTTRVTDPELYVRWLQLGTFSPILRTHAQQKPEPYLYPEQRDIILPLIKERYRWLPYNYTLAYENASKGLPLVRPLNFYSHGMTELDDITDEYLWGKDLLVAPVLEQGATSKRVVFPEGKWVDMANPSKLYNGGESITYPAPLNVLPLFVRAGAFIPTAEYAMSNTRGYRTDTYTISYYPVEGVKSEYTLFEDNLASSMSLDRGEYALIQFRGDSSSSSIEIMINQEGDYKGAPVKRELLFNVYRVSSMPKSIEVNGRDILTENWNYDKEGCKVTFSLNIDNGKASSIKIIL